MGQLLDTSALPALTLWRGKLTPSFTPLLLLYYKHIILAEIRDIQLVVYPLHFGFKFWEDRHSILGGKRPNTGHPSCPTPKHSDYSYNLVTNQVFAQQTASCRKKLTGPSTETGEIILVSPLCEPGRKKAAQKKRSCMLDGTLLFL